MLMQQRMSEYFSPKSVKGLIPHRIIFFLLLFALFSLAIFSSPARAFAQPEIFQTENAGELISVPTANILQGRGRIGAEYFGQSSRIFGAFSLENFIEVGGQVKAEELGLLLKVRILAEEREIPALAAGIRQTSPYFVASKYLGTNTSVHFGIGESEPDGLFLAFNTVFNPEVQGIVYALDDNDEFAMPRTNLMLEIIEDEVNAGIRTALAPELAAELSVLDLENIKAGINFNF